MSGSTPEPGLAYARLGVWHIVKAGPFRGSNVGSFYVFLCGRWAAENRLLGIARGRPTDRTDVCRRCEEISERPADDAAFFPADDVSDAE